MNWKAISFDWNQARAFLATAEEGSLSAAARALGQTQPTLGRQVAGLETALGVALFERVGRSLELTQAGRELLDHFRAMGEAAGRISLGASGKSQEIEGQVSITATDYTATYVLPPILAKIRETAPGIVLEIVPSNDVRDLLRREADISIRHARPQQEELIGRMIGMSSAQLYGASSYLDRIGRPRRPADLARAEFIGFGSAEAMINPMLRMGLTLTVENFPILTTSGASIGEMVRQGLGLSVMTREMAARLPGVELVMPELRPIEVPTWLVTHRELHTSRRIRHVWDALADGLAARAAG